VPHHLVKQDLRSLGCIIDVVMLMLRTCCRGIVAPALRLAKARRAASKRAEQRQELLERKKSALAKQRMMLPLIRRSRAEEDKNDSGLVIVKVRRNIACCRQGLRRRQHST
jgi:hypothetical protein